MQKAMRVNAACVLAMILVLLAPGLSLAHVVQTIGPYTTAMGWLEEPAYVGVQNAVQVIVREKASGNPVTDLASGVLHVIVSTGGQSTAPLPLDPTLDPDTGLGRPGEYLAWLIPTTPGDYTFHLTGSIHGQTVDETYTSSDQTFNPVEDAGAAQFPIRLPSLTEVSTLEGRLTTRVGTAAADAGTADATAASARDTATLALLVGGGIGFAGLVVALAALVVAQRAVKRARAA